LDCLFSGFRIVFIYKQAVIHASVVKQRLRNYRHHCPELIEWIFTPSLTSKGHTYRIVDVNSIITVPIGTSDAWSEPMQFDPKWLSITEQFFDNARVFPNDTEKSVWGVRVEGMDKMA
jgi:hypothetical protein